MEANRADCAVVVDTNILLDIPNIKELDWGVQSVKVFVLESVVGEIGKLSRKAEIQPLTKKAETAYKDIRNLQRQSAADGIELPNGGRLYFAPVPKQMPEWFEPGNVDQQQIVFATNYLQENPGVFCAIVTMDRKMAEIAHFAHPDLQVIMPSGFKVAEDKIRESLRHQYGWHSRIRPHDNQPAEDGSVKNGRPTPRTRPDPEARVDQVARSLYGRIRSTNHRAMLNVAPKELRIALTARLVSTLTNNKRRIVLLFVLDEQEAEYWVGELRKRCDLPAGAILVFGHDHLPRVGQTRVVIYRHDQIERRMEQHASRFAQAERRLTAIVDGCDLLDPVGIAMLLFECDQFIGFTRLPPGHVQATSGRMVEVFFDEETIATYTFADAEEDGWLHPFDVLRRPVTLTDDALMAYEKTNDKFLKSHGRMSRKYPELQRSSEFWRALLRVLVQNVDLGAAELFKLQEEREAIAQMAPAKREKITEMIEQAGAPARCLIFDHEGLWSYVLKRHLADHGRTVSVITPGIDQAIWEERWRQFKDGRIDAFILQEVPPELLSLAAINRLILLSPLTPLATLAAMTDWSLSHSSSGPAVCVDLLYTTGTPEQEAMMDFADTCCGLRYSR